ncbi:conserved hypothetical protein [Beggiatoa sp. PS]|nr:conserved hypothetical protein [Beggiatoa sp. PS]
MIDPKSLDKVGIAIRESIANDRELLEQMRADVRSLKNQTHRIKPQSSTAISLVATDGGNNQISFDPFMIQLIRVVDSNEKEYCLEVITPNTEIEKLNETHLNSDGTGKTQLGKMIKYLGLNSLHKLSPVFNLDTEKRDHSWVQIYREMTEWAILFALVRESDFSSDTIIVFDGLLRSKMFASGLFEKYQEGLEEGIKRSKKNRRNIYIVGIAKHNKILQTYRLAMAIEGIMRTKYPCYLEVSKKLEKVYKHKEYFTGSRKSEIFVAGKMFFVKFGKSPHDPIWAVDILKSQATDSGMLSSIFGHLLNDANEGFPVPFYPQCLQKAHEHAALVDFDMDILQEEIHKALREELNEKKWEIDKLALQEMDPSRRRYQ